jgi:6-pyruvoyltetrahydropterin/6-carboxytetrahydropterin synthase
MKLAVFRRAHFNAAHMLHNDTWNEEQNKAVFGKCCNPHYHGHNYELEVCVIGEIDPKTGFVINLDVLKKYIKEEVVEYLDHKNLNIQIPEFESLNPSAENICLVIWNKLRNRLNERYELKVRLFETVRNYVQYPAF